MIEPDFGKGGRILPAVAAYRGNRFSAHAGRDGFVTSGADIVFDPRRVCGDREEK